MKLKAISLPLTYIWLGFVLAISFFETPLKFQAPSISMEEGVEIGHLVFRWMNRIELLFVLILSLRWVYGNMPRKEGWLTGTLAFIVLAQMFILLPALGVQSSMLLDGVDGRNPIYHSLYVMCEVSKVALLLALGRMQLRQFNLT